MSSSRLRSTSGDGLASVTAWCFLDLAIICYGISKVLNADVIIWIFYRRGGFSCVSTTNALSGSSIARSACSTSQLIRSALFKIAPIFLELQRTAAGLICSGVAFAEAFLNLIYGLVFIFSLSSNDFSACDRL